MGERIEYPTREAAIYSPDTKSLPVRSVHRLSGRLSHIGRDGFQVVLGALWAIDGLLQLQPYMYEKGSNGLLGVVADNTMGHPNFITDFIAFVTRQMVAHQLIGNTTVALIQLAMGVLLIWSGARRYYGIARAALSISMAWALIVWVVGEGVGGLIMPQAAMLTGAPGAAILYGLAALYLWPSSKYQPKYSVPAGIRDGISDKEEEVSDHDNGCNDDRDVLDSADGYNDDRGATKGMNKPGGNSTVTLDSNKGSAVASHGLLGQTGSYIAWAILWCGSSLLEFQYGNFAPHSIPIQIRYEAKGEPQWISFMDLHIASILHTSGTVVAGILLVVEFAVGWLILRPATRRIALISGMVLAVVFWVVGQNFGTIFSGQATDLNSGPPLALLALLLWPGSTTRQGRRSASLGSNDASSGSSDAGIIHV